MKTTNKNLVMVVVSCIIGITLVVLALQGSLAQSSSPNYGGLTFYCRQTGRSEHCELCVKRCSCLTTDLNPAEIGSGYKIVGVDILLRPQNVTLNDGSNFSHWILEFVISNKPFVNGSTTSSSLSQSAITVSEVPTPNSTTRYESAMSFMAPPTICQTSLLNDSQTCSTFSQSNPYKLIEIRSTYLVVDPSVPNAYFLIAGAGKTIQIYAPRLNLPTDD